ncbi:MAG: DEAD/DEAH box helicase, partial [bacterium]|nr:DEAD/DEAH box helicase [bacterium]
EFDRTRRDFENARKRLRHRRKELSKAEPADKVAEAARDEVEIELRILRARGADHSRKQTLELLTDHGLLPNYAFPERGVPFYGSVYHAHEKGQTPEKPVEVIRPAAAALKELAPANHFYTHGRRFTIQQLSVGNDEYPLIKEWAICGACGHLRLVADLAAPGSGSACPQCGHDGDEKCQFDQGQHRQFLEFPKSQASSFMEHFDSLSADRDEERRSENYQKPVKSFDIVHYACVAAPCQRRGLLADRGTDFPAAALVWELELQPHLGKAHGVMVDSQPDFVLWCDDAGVR